MRSIPLGLVAAATLALNVAVAQTTTTTPGAAGTTGSTTTTTVVPPASVGDNAATRPNTAAPVTPMTNTSMPRDRHENGAVNTSSANAPTPAAGANSFTQGQARKRLMANGFANVSTLKKDNSGIWRGTAQRNGQTVPVWVDYRGDAGQQQ